MADDLATAVRESAGRLGIDPSDLLTAISYETGGRMSPSIYGGKGGQYLGLIQFSPENQKKYGVHPKQTAPEQMQAVESYLRDRGVKPGMGLLDTYSAINAGRPGLYNRSDAHNGGAPGTVADKVASMAGHRMRANALLGLEGDAGSVSAVQATPAPSAAQGAPSPAAADSAPFSLAPTGGVGTAAADDGIATALAALVAPQQAAQEETKFMPVPAMQMPAAPHPVALDMSRRVLPSALARVRAMANAMARTA